MVPFACGAVDTAGGEEGRCPLARQDLPACPSWHLLQTGPALQQLLAPAWQRWEVSRLDFATEP